ncbi:hypothetical protein E1B28_010273 [Marasmius oreades]|uniref:Oligopeptide transporter n=1 Tax=Marasmius oreades TaxID=181124 RepID=A0A9P7RXG9_9AGAR|nr:uncharacterized protein E1B28_010273 [Marasmius oreades]KAG7091222.1 hypothetical protein E1B28_010273 [Marasmius oreades]
MPRPITSSARPTTSAGGLPHHHQQLNHQFSYDAYDDDEEYEDDESDDDDVFAFQPPTTAEQQQHQLHQAALSYPSPTFDPQARFPADYPLSHSLPQPPSPPSTGSYELHTSPNDLRLNRIQSRPTTTSSRQIRVSIPGSPNNSAGKGRHRDIESSGTGAGISRLKSADADSLRESMAEDYDYDIAESREGSIKMDFDFDAIEEEDSPFPEVRASVSNIDDPDMPALTLRMWFVGLFLCLISGALNVFFNFRNPAPAIVPLALLLVSYPLGKFLAFTLPIATYRIPLPHLPSFLVLRPSTPPSKSSASTSTPSPPILTITQRLRSIWVNTLTSLAQPRSIEFSLNPGPWNIKEHVLVFIMANVAVGPPYAINAIVVSEVFYRKEWGYWFSLVLVMATQLTGFGLAGLCRRFLVWPASMVWPQNLVACTLLNTLHAEEEEEGNPAVGMQSAIVPAGVVDAQRIGGRATRSITRYKFFMWVLCGAFLWFFLPGFLFRALSIFSFICWAAPDNVPVNQLFGVASGLGMSFITFDWTQIIWIGSPLMVPWWAQIHVFLGFVLFYWILTPILYYTNSWDLAYFPISDNQPYDRFGQVYNVSQVLKPDDTFDPEAYHNYSPLYLPATYAVCYLIAFALSTCVITHTILYHGRSLLNGVKKIRVESDDIHAKLMRQYPEVPDWWYLVSFAAFFSLAIVAVEVWHTDIPVWMLVLAVLLPTLYVLPSGFIYAMTGQAITLNILAQIIPGSLLPGNPLANMVFKSYSVQTLTEATSFVQDLKLGHYVKVPPRATFIVQLVSTILAAFVQVGIKTWIFNNVPDICHPDQKSSLTCPHNQVFFTASAVWGLIGPTRQFGTGSPYHPHLYAIVIGAFLPVPFYFWQRRYPNSWVKYISTPVILNGVSAIPPAAGINYSSWFAIGFVFQYLVRKRSFAWWAKFNYVTSAALDCGSVLSLIFIFLTLQFPKNGTIDVNWWGNRVFLETADYKRLAFKQIPEGGLPWNGSPR